MAMTEYTMRLRSSSRWSRKPMAGSWSRSLALADSFRGEEADSSGIGRNLRSVNSRSGSRLGRRGKLRLYGGGILRNGIFRSFSLFGGGWVENAVGERSERGLEGRQD